MIILPTENVEEPFFVSISPITLKTAGEMNREIHKAHEKRPGTDHFMRWQTSPAGWPAVLGNALSFRVFRGFNRFFQDNRPLGGGRRGVSLSCIFMT